MNGKRLSIRLNLDKLNHKKAFDILSSLPSGRKSEYVISAIIRSHDTVEVLELVRQVLQENTPIKKKPIQSSNNNIDDVAIDYLKTL